LYNESQLVNRAEQRRSLAMSRFQLTALVGVALLAGSVAQAAISLDGNFDEGALESWSQSGSTVNVVGRDSYAFSNHQLGSGDWRWVYFKATGVQGQNLTFSIGGEFAGDSTDYPPTPSDHELKDHEMVYSYDNVNWNFFPHANNQLLNIGTPDTNGGNDIFKFGLGQAFAQDTVYVAYALPYQYSRTQALTQEVLASPWGMPTVSGNANGVIGQSPAGVDDIGRSIPALDLYAYRITNPATDSAAPKHKVMIATGQHAAETLGIHTYEGLVRWLISDDPRAAALRDKVEVFAYPTLNASGRYAGLSRAMLQFPNTDSNGYWSPVNSGNNYVSPERTEQKINAEAMRADMASTPGDRVNLFLDLHSSVPDYNIVGPNGQGGSLNPGDGLYRDDWGYITTGHENDPWWLALRALQPNLLQEGSSTSGKTLPAFARTYLNADMSVTLENQFAISRPISFYQNYGKNIGLAMYQAYVRVAGALPGDFDEDGDVDKGDLAAWQQGLGTSTGAQHYQGDANGDGRVDGADFLIWQRQFGAAAATTAPEPCSALIAFVLGAAMLTRRRLAK
jgi:hypothetical protein